MKFIKTVSAQTSVPLGEYEKALMPKAGEVDTTSLGSIISSLLPYIFTAAGLVLLIMLVLGGFTLLSGASSKESQEKGKKQITTALLGFFVIFLAYWIAQILQIMLNVEITN